MELSGTLSGGSLLSGTLNTVLGEYIEATRIADDGRVRSTENSDIRNAEIYHFIDGDGNLVGELSGDSSLEGILSSESSLDGQISGESVLMGEMTVPISTEGNPYSGDYTVEPGPEEIILPTRGKVLARNITVQPIPSNYGLVTWDGAVLTVS